MVVWLGSTCAAEVVVRVGPRPCALVPAPGQPNHEWVLCTAPARVVGGGSDVVVHVDGQQVSPLPFLYDGPLVTGVVPAYVDAATPGLDPTQRQVQCGVGWGGYATGLGAND